MLAALGRCHGPILERAIRFCRGDPSVRALVLGKPTVPSDRFDPLDLVVVIDIDNPDESDAPWSISLTARLTSVAEAVAVHLGPDVWRRRLAIDASIAVGIEVADARGVVTQIRVATVATLPARRVVAYERPGTVLPAGLDRAPPFARRLPERLTELFHCIGDAPKFAARPSAFDLSMEALAQTRLIAIEFVGCFDSRSSEMLDAIDSRRGAPGPWCAPAPHRFLSAEGLAAAAEFPSVTPEGRIEALLALGGVATVAGLRLLGESALPLPFEEMAALHRHLARHVGERSAPMCAILHANRSASPSADVASEEALIEDVEPHSIRWCDVDATEPDEPVVLPRNGAGVVHAVLAWAKADERVQCVGLAGSVGRGCIDPFSDLDIVVIVDEVSFQPFLATFAKSIGTAVPAINFASSGKDFIRMTTAGWLSVEIMARPEYGPSRWSSMAYRPVLDRRVGGLQPSPSVEPTAPDKRRELAGVAVNQFMGGLREMAAALYRHDRLGAIEAMWTLRDAAVSAREVARNPTIGRFGRAPYEYDALLETAVFPSAPQISSDVLISFADAVRGRLQGLCADLGVAWPAAYDAILSEAISVHAQYPFR